MASAVQEVGSSQSRQASIKFHSIDTNHAAVDPAGS